MSIPRNLGTFAEYTGSLTGTAGSVVLSIGPSLTTPVISSGLQLSGSSSGTVTLTTAAVAGTWSLTLPTSGGTNNYVLTTNGSGTTSWSQVSLSGGVTGVLPAANGGTGQSTNTIHGVLIGNAGNAINATSAGTSGQLLTSGGASADPLWTTATYPATATGTGTILRADGTNWSATTATYPATATGTGTILRADGTNWSATTATYPTTTAAGTLLASGSANTITASATPTLGVAGTTAGTLALTGVTSGTVTIQTAAAAGTWSLTLPTSGGTNKYALTTNGSGVGSWSQIDLAAAVTGVLPVANGGTGASSASITAFNNITGYTASGATGTTSTNLVFSTSPTLTKPVATGLIETKTAPSISSGTLTIDCSVGNVFAVSLNANITTLTFSNVPTTGNAFSVTLSFTADGTARTITWGTPVKWPGGTAPTLTSTNGKVDTFVLYTFDAGTTWYAFTAGQNS